MNCAAKIRYRQSDQSCRTEQLDNDYLKVIFDKPQRAITPGQSIVFYNNAECLGGGIIESMYNNET
jgi:tRNA-specific 2-thiouridylase